VGPGPTGAHSRSRVRGHRCHGAAGAGPRAVRQ